MKMTDDLSHQVFDEIGTQYPDLEREYQIIDIGTAFVAVHSERHDHVVALRMHGEHTRVQAGTQVFADVVIDRLGQLSQVLPTPLHFVDTNRPARVLLSAHLFFWTGQPR